MASPGGTDRTASSLASTADLNAFATATNLPVESMDVGEITQLPKEADQVANQSDHPLSTAMEMSVDGDGIPTNPVLSSQQSSEVGTTVVGVGPIGTQFSEVSPDAHIYCVEMAPTVPVLTLHPLMQMDGG
eukprot:909832-Amphidinium_carterae.1